jgi:hypothetical protein
VLMSSWHKGRLNIIGLLWHTMMEFEPPLVGWSSMLSHGHWLDRARRPPVVAGSKYFPVLVRSGGFMCDRHWR